MSLDRVRSDRGEVAYLFVSHQKAEDRGTLMDLEEIRAAHWFAPIFLVPPRTYGYLTSMFQTAHRFMERAPGCLQWSSGSLFPLIIMADVEENRIVVQDWPKGWGVTGSGPGVMGA